MLMKSMAVGFGVAFVLMAIGVIAGSLAYHLDALLGSWGPAVIVWLVAGTIFSVVSYRAR